MNVRFTSLASLAIVLASIAQAAFAEGPFDDYKHSRRKGERAFAKGRYDEALASFVEARDIAPCDEAYVNVVRTLRNLGRYEQSIVMCEEAIVTRQERLDTLVDRKMFMFQERELYAEIVSSAILLVFTCDASARRASSGAPPMAADILQACGGPERARALSALLCQDVDEYLIARVEEYLHERMDSGFHEPMVYRAARGVCRRRSDAAGVEYYARLERADEEVAALEREHGATPFLPSPRELEKFAPKWLAISLVYDRRGFPSQAGEARSRHERFRELAAAADVPGARVAEFARRRAMHASARSELGVVKDDRRLTDTPLVSQPRGSIPSPIDDPIGDPLETRPKHERPHVEASFRPADGDVIQDQSAVLGTVKLTYAILRLGALITLRVDGFHANGSKEHVVRAWLAEPPSAAITIASGDVGATMLLGTVAEEPSGAAVDITVGFEAVEIDAAP